MRVEITRECKRCRNKVNQSVLCEEKDRKIVVSTWQAHCPLCNAFLKKPTEAELEMVVVIEREVAATKRLYDRVFPEGEIDLSEVDREIVRASLVEIAETLRRKYQMTVEESRRQLHQMMDVSV